MADLNDRTERERGEKETHRPFVADAPERELRFESLSGIPIRPLYTPADLEDWRYGEKLGYPGEFPFTRGPYPSLCRGRFWTMRMFAGFGPPAHTNARITRRPRQRSTGSDTAFDMPALMG